MESKSTLMICKIKMVTHYWLQSLQGTTVFVIDSAGFILVHSTQRAWADIAFIPFIYKDNWFYLNNFALSFILFQVYGFLSAGTNNGRVAVTT